MNSIDTFPGFVNRCAARMRGLDKAPGLRHHERDTAPGCPRAHHGGTDLTSYPILWEGQSEDSSQSMPLGGHDVGCNVWAQDGALCLYLSQNGAFDENNTLLKLGRLRLTLPGTNALAHNYRQELAPEEGTVTVTAGEPGQRVRFLLWVDVTNANLHIRFSSEQPARLQVEYATWRHRARPVAPQERGQCRDLASIMEDAPLPDVVTLPDRVQPTPDGLLFCHRNDNARLVYDRLIAQQGLEPVRDCFPNPLRDRVMGGYLTGEGLRHQGSAPGRFESVDEMRYRLAADPATETEVVVAMETGVYPCLADWERAVRGKARQGISLRENMDWWARYFARSFIRIDPEHPGSEMWKVGRNYQLFRYMLGCNYYGAWPTKFNGGLFTFLERFTPDYRNWSGGDFTAQNQRLVYWPMLKSGDWEAMKPQLDFYLDRLPAGKARAQVYWGHGGAYFPEQMSGFGTSIGAEYKWNRRPGALPGEDDSPWVRMHYSTALEFALMMLQWAEYSGESAEPFLDFAFSVARFYFEHYPLDEEGKLRIFPSTALETYKGEDPQALDGERYGAENPMDAVAGLRDLLDALSRCCERLGLEDGLRQCRAWLDLCPALPMGRVGGRAAFLPAQRYAPTPFNCELPQLYRVFPFSHRGLSPEEIEAGRAAYEDPALTPDQRLTMGWHQNGIFAARLKLTDEAMRIAREKLGDSGRRFPAFWGPGHDWTPDHNWGGSGMIGLQEMLVQVAGDGYELLPAWDRSVDVHFRLFMPGGRPVQCRLSHGRLELIEG